MAELPNLGQESVHETFRIVIPGYFALFAAYTLYPQIFYNNTSGIALALVGGIGVGVVLYGLNLQDCLPIFKPLGKMRKEYESRRTKTMITIWDEFNKNNPNKIVIDKTDKFYSNFWSNFSYTQVPESVRARQRMYASMFYLYANCSIVMLGYFAFVCIAISNPQTTQFLSFHSDLRFDAARLVLSGLLAVFFWFKAKGELGESMSFQETAMYCQAKELCTKLSEVGELREKIAKEEKKV